MSGDFSFFSKNGQIFPREEATIPISNIEYSYGFGVYETLKVRNGVLYFVDQHVERLFHSAEIIGLTHSFTKESIKQYLQELLHALGFDSSDTSACNIKMLLIGGKEPLLYIIPLRPLFPDRKLYSHGAKTLTVHYERLFPHAKTLNMLGSYLAYKKAKENGCYDALLLNNEGYITEGTRTNFFTIKDKTIFSPPEKDILEGVTRLTVLYSAKQHGFTIKEKEIMFSNLNEYEGAFLTSTSSKIIPIKQIDDFVFSEIPQQLKDLMHEYNSFLNESQGILSVSSS